MSVTLQYKSYIKVGKTLDTLDTLDTKQQLPPATAADITEVYQTLRNNRKPPNEQGLYEGVVGRLRYEAAKRAVIPEILVRVHRFTDEGEVLEWQLAENLHRKEMTALEKVDGERRLVDIRKKRFPEESAIQGVAIAIEGVTGMKTPEKTVRKHVEISRKIGNKARKNALGIAKEKALNVKISHLTELSRVENEDVQAYLLERVASEKWALEKFK